MEIKRGIAVSSGVAIGPALLLDTEWFRIPQRYVEAEQVDAEVERLHEALEAAAAKPAIRRRPSTPSSAPATAPSSAPTP